MVGFELRSLCLGGEPSLCHLNLFPAPVGGFFPCLFVCSEQKNSLMVDVEPEDTVTVLSKIYIHLCESRKSDLGPLGVSLNPKAVFRLSTGRQASTLTPVLVTCHSLARLPSADAVRARKHQQSPVGTLRWCVLLARVVADHELKGILGGGVLKFLRVPVFKEDWG